jgi:hypothetical protein
MARKQSQHNPPKRLTRNGLIIYGGIVAIAAGIGYFGFNSTIPVNSSSPALGFMANHNYIKATYSRQSGYQYVSQSSGAVKGIKNTGGSASLVNPTYTFSKGELESMHFINEDYDTHSAHNFNIDAFNVHTKDLGYYEAQTITFIADKPGTYDYYCTIHPEMKGNIIVE